MDSRWGHCMHCKHFASPARVPLAEEEARCNQPELSRFQLTVFGLNGCVGWELREGLSPTVEEPRRAPEAAQPA